MTGLSVDISKCSGCRACEMACSFAHESLFSPALTRVRVVKLEDLGVDVPVTCRSCERPACVEVCPRGALNKGRWGGVVVDTRTCDGCALCVAACPFGCLEMHESKGLPLVCDMCGGDPECVKWCATGALQYGQAGNSAQLRREAIALAAARALREGWPSPG